MTVKIPITETAHLTHCSRCGAPVLRAIVDGTDTTADPDQPTLDAEIVARATGRGSFDVLTIGAHVELAWRDVDRIRADRHPKVLEHRCPDGGKPQGAFDPDKAIPLKAVKHEKQPYTTGKEPPF